MTRTEIKNSLFPPGAGEGDRAIHQSKYSRQDGVRIRIRFVIASEAWQSPRERRNDLKFWENNHEIAASCLLAMTRTDIRISLGPPRLSIAIQT